MAVRQCIMIMHIVTWSHSSGRAITYRKGAMVESLRQRGWPQDDIDAFFRDWRSDEENSEKEQLTHCVTGTPPHLHTRVMCSISTQVYELRGLGQCTDVPFSVS